MSSSERRKTERYSIAESESAMPETVATPVDGDVGGAAICVDSIRRPRSVGRCGFLQRRSGSGGLPSLSMSSAAIEQSRSAVWPIVLALAVGLLVGFAGGYGSSACASMQARARRSQTTAASSTELPSQGSAAQPGVPAGSAPAVPAPSAAAPPVGAPGAAPATSRTA